MPAPASASEPGHDSEPALAGTTVVELGDGIAGAYCAKLLAQYGARVVKIEPRGGDRTRRAGPFSDGSVSGDSSGLFLYLNGGKQGVTLELATRDGRTLLERLLRLADIFVESLAPGVLAELGFDDERLAATRPSLVTVSVTPFGQAGPYSAYQSTDLINHAVGGWLYAGGATDREPLKPGGSLSEYGTGLVAAVGAMTALWYSRNSSVGQRVDVSAMESMLSLLGTPTLRYSMTGQEWQRSRHQYPFTIFPCADGYIGVNILTQRQWEAMCRFIGKDEWIEDPLFQSGLLRQQPEVIEIISDTLRSWLSERTQEEIIKGQAERIPFALLPTVPELLESPQYRERGFFVEVDHPDIGSIRQPGLPFKLSDATPASLTPAPKLGEHNAAVYGGLLGCPAEELVLLTQSGAI